MRSWSLPRASASVFAASDESNVERFGVAVGSLRSSDALEMASSCDASSPLKSLTTPLPLYSEPESHSLFKDDRIRSVPMAFLRSASLTLILRRLVPPEAGALPLIVRSGDDDRTAEATCSTVDDALASVTSSSVDEVGTRGEVWMVGSGLLTAGVAGGLVNISAIGDDETTRCIWGIGGTGGASSLW